jgi:hypothetical protein
VFSAHHGGCPTADWETEGGWLEAVEAIVCGWAADGAADVSADAENRASEANEGALTT